MLLSHFSLENFETAPWHLAAAADRHELSPSIVRSARTRLVLEPASKSHPAPPNSISSGSAPIRAAKTGTECAHDSRN
jgi:hypothetical protein